MAATINATPGAADANSYITLAEAANFADGDIAAEEWYTSTTDQRTRALISATRTLDLVEYSGTRTNATQALAWPRTGVKTADGAIASNVIPPKIKEATWEVAKSLLKEMVVAGQTAGSTSLIPGIPNAGLQRVKIDVLEVEWRKNPPLAITPLKALPQLQQLLQDLILNTPGQTRLVVRS